MTFMESSLGKHADSRIAEGNPALVRAMRDIALNENPENRKKVYEALLGSMLLVPVPEIPADLSSLGPGLHTATSKTQIQLRRITDRNQVQVTAAFTDLEALRNWDSNTPYLGLNAPDLFRLVMGTDIQEIAINPFDPVRKMIRPGGRVTRSEFELLSKGIVLGSPESKIAQVQLKANEKVLIGRPANPPGLAVEELLRSNAATFSAIAELYVFQMATQAGSSHTVVGINLSEDVSREQQDEIARSLGTSVQGELKGGQSLDFMFLRGAMREQIRGLGALIFRRE
jgi:SseB protein N-terminal domain/SseB protein C-terminal domain